MKRIARDRYTLFLLVGALVAVAGITSAAGLRRHAAPDAPVAKVEAPAAIEGKAAPAVTPTDAIAITPTMTSTLPTLAPAAPVASGEMGMRIYKDPETGEIGPPNADLVSEAGASEDGSDLQVVRMPDGSLMMDLKGRFQESMVVKIDANGKRTVSCVQGSAAEQRFHEQAAPVQSQREDR